MKAIINANAVLPNGILWDAVILISGEKIAEVKSAIEADIPKDAEIIDAKGAYVGPGFVDIHVHGAGGFSTIFNTEKAAEYLLSHGETSILCTQSYNQDFETFINVIRSIKEIVKSGNAKNVKGMYAEGPYTNPKYGSRSKPIYWDKPIDPQEYKAIVDEAGSFVKVWTIAPEREGIKEFTEYVRKVNPNAIFSVGHSEATPMQIRALGKYRPKILTHMMCATGRQKAYVLGYGPDEYCAKEPEMYAELISDSCGIHVHPELQQFVLHTKGLDKVILITDGTALNNPVPERLKHVKDLNFDANGGIAGSKLTMDLACKNIMAHTNCGIAQAFLMASTNPAKALGLDEEIGSIEAGKTADLVFVDDKFNVKEVMLGGEIQKF